MKSFKDRNEYLEQYKGKFENNSLQTEALRQALDIRKLEIEMYWKRTAYFWTLIAATFAGYFALKTATRDLDCYLIILISCIGFVVSFGWYIANRGAKYWQENWELQVDLLEDNVMGPLYKTTPRKKWFSSFHPIGAYPFSVSKVNQLLSLFITLIWACLVFIESYPIFQTITKWKNIFSSIVIWIPICSFIAVIILFFCSRTNRKKNINFELNTREY